MQRSNTSRPRAHRGGILLGVLCFSVVTGFIIAGVAEMVVSHFNRANVEGDYARALYMAEAGVNYELNVISLNSANADQVSVASPSGNKYSLGGGSFRVYCENANGSTPWTPGKTCYIVSSGTINGITRSITINALGNSGSATYAIYSTNALSTWNGSSITINGDVGTNNQLNFNGSPTVNGGINFNGPYAGWSSGGTASNGYTVSVNPNPLSWLTVDQIALNTFPPGQYGAGGMAYIKLNNDNAKAVPPIVGYSVTNSVTLKGPGNYYVENVNQKATQLISLDNTNGPINLWIGPDQGPGVFSFHGGTAAISPVNDLSKQNHFYCAATTGITMAGNEVIDAVLYCYNTYSATGLAYGSVVNKGNPTINGQIVGDSVDLGGNITVNYVSGMQPYTFEYYAFGGSYTESNTIH